MKDCSLYCSVLMIFVCTYYSFKYNIHCISRYRMIVLACFKDISKLGYQLNYSTHLTNVASPLKFQELQPTNPPSGMIFAYHPSLFTPLSPAASTRSYSLILTTLLLLFREIVSSIYAWQYLLRIPIGFVISPKCR